MYPREYTRCEEPYPGPSSNSSARNRRRVGSAAVLKEAADRIAALRSGIRDSAITGHKLSPIFSTERGGGGRTSPGSGIEPAIYLDFFLSFFYFSSFLFSSRRFFLNFQCKPDFLAAHNYST